MAWRISSASVWTFGLQFTSAARSSRLPVAVTGTWSWASPEPPVPAQPVSTSRATAVPAASFSRVHLMCSSGRSGPCRQEPSREPCPSVRLRRAPCSMTPHLSLPDHANPVSRTAQVCEGERSEHSGRGGCVSTQAWESRVAAAWAGFDDYAEEDAADFRAVIDALVSELPDDSPLGLFERACAWDSTGHSGTAVPLYQEALARGLD